MGIGEQGINTASIGSSPSLRSSECSRGHEAQGPHARARILYGYDPLGLDLAAAEEEAADLLHARIDVAHQRQATDSLLNNVAGRPGRCRP